MQLQQFHKLRQAVQVNASPVTPGELRALRRDVAAALASVGVFDEVEVDWTDDVDNLVIAMFRFPEHVSHEDVAHALELMWQDRFRFPFWEAHSLLTSPDHVEFQGATRAATDGRYVTLHIVAQRGFVPAQRTPSE